MQVAMIRKLDFPVSITQHSSMASSVSGVGLSLI